MKQHIFVNRKPQKISPLTDFRSPQPIQRLPATLPIAGIAQYLHLGGKNSRSSPPKIPEMSQELMISPRKNPQNLWLLPDFGSSLTTPWDAAMGFPWGTDRPTRLSTSPRVSPQGDGQLSMACCDSWKTSTKLGCLWVTIRGVKEPEMDDG